MKKPYEKPEVAFERFQMTQSIAGTCYFIMNSGQVEVCETKENAKEYIDAGGFVTGNGECSYKIYDYCYTNSSALFNTHTS